MKKVFPGMHFVRTGTAALAVILILAAGCRNQPAARTDEQMAADVQARISGEKALSGQNIQVSVTNGIATLSGTASDEASRALAGNDSGTVQGVKTVVNNLIVQPAPQAAASVANPAPQPAPPAQPVHAASPPHETTRDKHHRPDRAPDRNADRPQVAQASPAPVPDPPPVQAVAPAPVPQAPPPPPAPPKPVIKQVTLPAGTVIPVRLTETLDSKTAQPNDVFHGSLAGDLGTQGVIAVPHRSPVMGRVVDAREAAHFKGSALLSIELTELTVGGKSLTLVTDTFSKETEGRGKNTAEKAGGGAALGAIIGALAGGGKGAAIGGLAGGAAGTGVNAATRGEQAVIPTETLINFRLQSPLTITVTIPPTDQDNGEVKDPQLQRR